MQHDKLVAYLDEVAKQRGLTLTELSRDMGLNQNQLGNIQRGTVPGLTVCLDIARALNLKPDYVLYLAGHIEESELDSPAEIPAEILPTLQRLQRLRGTPFYDTALDIMEAAIDKVIKLFDLAA